MYFSVLRTIKWIELVSQLFLNRRVSIKMLLQDIMPKLERNKGNKKKLLRFQKLSTNKKRERKKEKRRK